MLLQRGRDVAVVVLIAVVTAAVGRSIRATIPRAMNAEEATRYRVTPGPELLIVFIGSSTCGIAQDGDAQEAFRASVRELRRQAHDHQIARVTTAGVAVDWLPDSGLAFLRKVSAFDEMIVGHSWLNTGVERYVRAVGGEMAVPQVVVIRRNVRTSPSSPRQLAITDEQILMTAVGLEPLLAWSRAGAPVNWSP